MKKIVNVATPAVCVVALVLSVAAISNTNAATAPTPVVASAPAGQPVDLTFAAEKALPSVVYNQYRIQRFRPLNTTIHLRTSSQIPLADFSDVDKVTTASVSVRCRPRSVQQQALVSLSLPTVISSQTTM